MKVYIEFDMENWDEFKALVEYLMGNDSKYELHTLGTLEITRKVEKE